jgi:uncharacterized membrane protein
MEKNIFFYIKALSLIGIILAVYLLWEQFFHPSFQPCNINSTINCNAIISGAVAKTFGIPTPLYGLSGYIIIFLSAIFRKKKLLLEMSIFGLAFCLWIAYIELFQLHVICPVCILCQIIMLSVCSLAVFINKKTSSS